MTLQTLLGQHWFDPHALWQGLDLRRRLLHQQIPCRLLGGRSPLQVYPHATHSGGHYRPEWEADLLVLERVYEYLARCRWFRLVKSDGRLALGGYNYYLSKTWRGRTLEVSFDPAQAVFVAQVEGTQTTLTIPPQGLTIEDLMGELDQMRALPSYQLALPFTQETWRHLTYADILAGTIS